MRRVLGAVGLLVLLAGCGASTVTGLPAGVTTAAVNQTTTSPRTTASQSAGQPTLTSDQPVDQSGGQSSDQPTQAADVPTAPASFDPSLPKHLCDGTFPGRQGAQMRVMIIEMSNGFEGCDNAIDILADYYKQRPNDPFPADPLTVDGASCRPSDPNDQPQTVCLANGYLFYSMWPDR